MGQHMAPDMQSRGSLPRVSGERIAPLEFPLHRTIAVDNHILLLVRPSTALGSWLEDERAGPPSTDLTVFGSQCYPCVTFQAPHPLLDTYCTPPPRTTRFALLISLPSFFFESSPSSDPLSIRFRQARLRAPPSLVVLTSSDAEANKHHHG